MSALLFDKDLFACNQVLETVVKTLFVDGEIQYENLAWVDLMFDT